MCRLSTCGDRIGLLRPPRCTKRSASPNATARLPHAQRSPPRPGQAHASASGAAPRVPRRLARSAKIAAQPRATPPALWAERLGARQQRHRLSSPTREILQSARCGKIPRRLSRARGTVTPLLSSAADNDAFPHRLPQARHQANAAASLPRGTAALLHRSCLRRFAELGVT